MDLAIAERNSAPWFGSLAASWMTRLGRGLARAKPRPHPPAATFQRWSDSRNCLTHLSTSRLAFRWAWTTGSKRRLVAHKSRLQDVKRLVETFKMRISLELEITIARCSAALLVRLGSATRSRDHGAPQMITTALSTGSWCRHGAHLQRRQQYLLTENQSTYILRNLIAWKTPKIPLEIIEVQSGLPGEDATSCVFRTCTGRV